MRWSSANVGSSDTVYNKYGMRIIPSCTGAGVAIQISAVDNYGGVGSNGGIIRIFEFNQPPAATVYWGDNNFNKASSDKFDITPTNDRSTYTVSYVSPDNQHAVTAQFATAHSSGGAIGRTGTPTCAFFGTVNDN